MAGKTLAAFLKILCSICLLHAIKANVCPPNEETNHRAGEANACPPNEETNPCICYSAQRHTLQCDQLSKVIDLENVLERTKDYSFGEFKITNSALKYIPTEAFNLRNVQFIIVLRTTLTNLVDKTPTGESVSIKSLEITSSQIKRGLEWEPLSFFTHLEELSIISSKTVKISKDFVRYVPDTVKTISIEDCDIKKLEDDSFAKFSKLWTIEMRRNKIQTLKRSMFPADLKFFDFGGNRISTLPNDLFQGMSKLKNIKFSQNLITTINEETFKSVTNLFRAYFMENPLRCDCKIKWTIAAPGSYEGYCAEPSQFKEKNVDAFIESDFAYCAN